MSRANRHFEKFYDRAKPGFVPLAKVFPDYGHRLLAYMAFAAGFTQGKRQMRSAIGGKKRKAVKR